MRLGMPDPLRTCREFKCVRGEAERVGNLNQPVNRCSRKKRNISRVASGPRGSV